MVCVSFLIITFHQFIHVGRQLLFTFSINFYGFKAGQSLFEVVVDAFFGQRVNANLVIQTCYGSNLLLLVKLGGFYPAVQFGSLLLVLPVFLLPPL